jgi:hypothetical protein
VCTTMAHILFINTFTHSLLELHTYKASALPLELHLQSILRWLFFRWGLSNHWPRLTLNHDCSYHSLSSS